MIWGSKDSVRESLDSGVATKGGDGGKGGGRKKEEGERKRREESRVDYSIYEIICDELWGESIRVPR